VFAAGVTEYNSCEKFPLVTLRRRGSASLQSALSLQFAQWTLSTHIFHRVRTDPGKVWKVMEFKVEIFQVWKTIENDLRCGKVMESVTANLEN